MDKNNVGEILDDLLIIPDTNILLYLYKCSFNSNQNIVELLEKVKEKVIIPNRVYKEFLAHKDKEQAKIDRKYDTFTKELKKQINELKTKIKGSISESRKYEFPNCNELETGIGVFLDKAEEAITTYQNSLLAEKQNKSIQIENVDQLIQYWINENKINTEQSIIRLMEIVREGEVRYRYKMPPGYMDEEEKDKDQKNDFESRIRKYGDLFIWKEVLSIAKSEQIAKYLLFLTNDIKEDWWVLKNEQSNREAVRMRDELKKEYVAETGNDKIEFMTLNTFYKMFSDYYQICDIKTTLELDYESYVQEQIKIIHKPQVDMQILDYLEQIDLEDFGINVDGIERTEIQLDEIYIEEIAIHYDDDGETAIYDIKLFATTCPIHISEKLCRNTRWLADIELKAIVSLEIHRDLRNLDESAILFKTFSYEFSIYRDAEEVYSEIEADARAEADDALEEYYNH